MVRIYLVTLSLLLSLISPTMAQSPKKLLLSDRGNRSSTSKLQAFGCKDHHNDILIKFNQSGRLRLKQKNFFGLTSPKALSRKEVANFFKQNHLARTKEINKVFKADFKKLERKAIQRNPKLRNKITSRVNRVKRAYQKYQLDNVYEVKALLATCKDGEALLRELKRHPYIEHAEFNMKVKAYQANDALYNSSGQYWDLGYDELWGLKQIKADQAWSLTQGQNTIVAVVDTGIDFNHPDLWDNIWVDPQLVSDINSDGKINLDDLDADGNKYIAPGEIIGNSIGYDFAYDDNDPFDFHGHGTHVAGTIGAVRNNQIGIVGVAPQTKILPVQILDAYGFGFVSEIAAGIEYLTELMISHPNVDNLISNNSYGGTGHSEIMAEAFSAAKDAGVIHIAAAGNSDDDAGQHIPAAFDSVISVGASGTNLKRAGFSSFGISVDLAAPGGGDNFHDSRFNIVSTQGPDSSILASRSDLKVQAPDNSSYTYARLAGTSMATPHVAGVTALIKARHPNFSFEEVRDILANSVQKVTQEPSKPIGQGVVDALAASSTNTSYPRAEIQNLGKSINGNYNFDLLAAKSTHGAELSSASLAWSYDNQSWLPITLSGSLPNVSASLDTTLVKEDLIYLKLTVTDILGQTTSRIEQVEVNNFDLTSPLNADIVNKFDTVDIRASFHTDQVADFELLYSTEEQPNTWLDTAADIDSSKVGRTFVNETIANLDPSLLTADKIYNIKLRIEYLNGNSVETEPSKIYLDSQLKAGFPIYSNYPTARPYRNYPIAIANIDGGDDLEIVKLYEHFLANGSFRERLEAFKADGSKLWSIELVFPRSKLVVLDADKDGIDEIYFTASAIIDPPLGVGIYSVDGNGQVRTVKSANDSFSRLHAADVDNDSEQELVVRSSNFSSGTSGIEVIDPISGITEAIVDTTDLSFFYGQDFELANLDADPELEVVHPGGDFGETRPYAHNFDGTAVAGWPPTSWQSEDIIMGNLSKAGDLNNDGIDEIVFESRDIVYRLEYGYYYIGGISILDASANPMGASFLELSDFHESNFSFADVDEDGFKDVVFTAGVFQTGKLYAVDRNNSFVDGWPKLILKNSIREPHFELNIDQLTLADINNDKKDDFLFSFGGFGSKFYTKSKLSDTGGVFAFNHKAEPLDLNAARSDTEVMPMATCGDLQPYGWKFVQNMSPVFVTDLEQDSSKEIISARDLEYGYENLEAFESAEPYYKTRSAIYAWALAGDIETHQRPLPKPDFSFSPKTPRVNETVTLDASASEAEEGIAEYHWDVDNDGNYDYGGRITFEAFNSSGIHTVTLKIVDTLGQEASISKDIEIFVDPPSSFDFSYSPNPPSSNQIINFKVSDYDSNTGNIVRFDWDFDNDGQVDRRGESVIYNFTENGTQTVTLTGITANDEESSVTKDIEVLEQSETDGDHGFHFGIEEGRPLRIVNLRKGKRRTKFKLYKTESSAGNDVPVVVTMPPEYDPVMRVKVADVTSIPAELESIKIPVKLRNRKKFKKRYKGKKVVDIPVTVTNANNTNLTKSSFIRVKF